MQQGVPTLHDALRMLALPHDPSCTTEGITGKPLMQVMKVLSVRQPWANAFFYSDKDVENRSWYTRYRGPLLIHASRTIDHAACREVEIPEAGLVTGAIIGIVDLTDVVPDSKSQWARENCWHWLFENRRLLAEPIRCLGKCGIFEVEIAVSKLPKGVKP